MLLGETTNLDADGYMLLQLEELTALKGYEDFIQSYENLAPDDFPGCRRRSYWRGRYCPKSYELKKSELDDRDGRLIKFPSISDQIMKSEFLNTLVANDYALARQQRVVGDADVLSVGLHQIRYAPTTDQVAYSRPAWFHKDGPPVVCIHFVRQTEGLLGGMNLIARDPEVIDRCIHHSRPLSSLVVTGAIYHAVMPMAAPDKDREYVRDILLVTFEPLNYEREHDYLEHVLNQPTLK